MPPIMNQRPIDRRKMLRTGVLLGAGTWVAPSIVPIDIVSAAAASGTTYSFDTPSTEGWVIDNTAGPSGGGLWKLDNSRSTSASYSLHYGNGSSGSYRTGNSASSGTVTSPSFSVADTGDQSMMFNIWREVEPGDRGGFPYDAFTVSVQQTGDVLYTRAADGGTSGAWEAVTLDLSAYIGSTINIVLSFDTVDGVRNHYEGIYVDDICFGRSVNPPAAGAAPGAAPSANGYFPTQPEPTQEQLALRALDGFEGDYPEYIELPPVGEKTEG
ncbi:MAG: hypothetical protein HKN26_07020 [Acidimicrobiales bacterium]|nr:hypothetical protein [Acidimicrobiales bacterium]